MNLGIGSKRLWVFEFDGSVSWQATASKNTVLHARCEAMLRFLAKGPWNRVAVISTRRLDDLAARSPLPKVFLGGCCGLEWEIPGGYRSCPDKRVEKILGIRRRSIAPILSELASIPGIEVEDRNWSVAIRYRDATARHFLRWMHLLQRLRNRAGIKVYRTYEGVEVQMVPGGSKSAGVRRLCRLIDWNPSAGEIIYAGSDETDVTAMKWVLFKGGTAFVVGGGITVPNARYVNGPADLAAEIHAYPRTATNDTPSELRIEAFG